MPEMPDTLNCVCASQMPMPLEMVHVPLLAVVQDMLEPPVEKEPVTTAPGINAPLEFLTATVT